MIRHCLVFIFLLAGFMCPLTSYAQQYDFNTRCKQAYDLVFSLRLEEGKALLEQEKRDNPDNLIPWFIENYIDFFVIYIEEDESDFEVREQSKDNRIDLMKSGSKSSPWRLYTQAEIHLQWALARLKFEEYLSAFREIRRAFKLLEENREKYPDFSPNFKSLGLLHAIIGAIPDQYKWGVNIVGLDGTIAQGMGELRAILQQAEKEPFLFEQETWVYYTLMTLYLENDADAAWHTIDAERLQLEDHLLNHFVAASVAMRTGRNDRAIEILLSRPSGPQYYSFSYLDFMLGLAKARRLDEDAAAYFHQFLEEFPGRNYVRETFQKLAWLSLINNDQQAYTYYMQQCIQRGTSVIDDDKQAEAEGKSGVAPHPDLLRARLLFDGGYYKRALEILEGKEADDFERPRDQVEFTYRAGRIYDAAGQPEKAKGYYAATLQRGEDLPYYFAANAALHMGYIYEEAENFEMASFYFKRCLRMKDHEYRNSISSKAKAGLNRIK